MLTTIFTMLLAGTLVYLVLAIVAAGRYLGVKPSVELAGRDEPVSILKPLKGLDINLEVNLRSFFEQDYTNFEILFAVRGLDDPAVPVVDALRREYADIPTRL